jgi:hypothetical protein
MGGRIVKARSIPHAQRTDGMKFGGKSPQSPRPNPMEDYTVGDTVVALKASGA